MKGKRPVPGYDGRNIACHVQKKFLRKRQEEKALAVEEKISQKSVADVVDIKLNGK